MGSFFDYRSIVDVLSQEEPAIKTDDTGASFVAVDPMNIQMLTSRFTK